MEILFFILSLLSTILKFFLLAILWILLFIIIILLIILIVPFKVKVNANIKSDNLKIEANNINGNIFITYLFKIIRVNLYYSEGKSHKEIKVLFFNLTNKKEKKKKSDNNNLDKKNNKIVEVKEELFNENFELKEAIVNVDEESYSNNEKEFKDANSDNNESKKTLKEKIIFYFNKYISIKNYPNKKLILKLTLDYLLKIIKLFKPIYINIEGKLGLDNPADTGQIIGVLSILDSFSYLNMDLSPDYDNECIDTKVSLYIKFTLWAIIINIIIFFIKALRLHLKGQEISFIQFIKIMRKKKGDKNGK